MNSGKQTKYLLIYLCTIMSMMRQGCRTLLSPSCNFFAVDNFMYSADLLSKTSSKFLLKALTILLVMYVCTTSL